MKTMVLVSHNLYYYAIPFCVIVTCVVQFKHLSLSQLMCSPIQTLITFTANVQYNSNTYHFHSSCVVQFKHLSPSQLMCSTIQTLITFTANVQYNSNTYHFHSSCVVQFKHLSLSQLIGSYPSDIKHRLIGNSKAIFFHEMPCNISYGVLYRKKNTHSKF